MHPPHFFLVCAFGLVFTGFGGGDARQLQAALLEGVNVRDVREGERCLSLLVESRRYSQEKFREFVVLLRRNGWDVDHPLLGFGPWRCEWELSKGPKDQ